MEASVLYLVFNRPRETKASFELLRKVQPKRLYVAADGYRKHVDGEQEKCQEVRDHILNNIDWDCELQTLFREENLGCGSAVQGALDWFFENEAMGIILEDDLLPDPSFFNYASVLLDRYKDDPKIFSINGCNFGYTNTEAPYGCTRYFNMWGWATWRRSNQLVKKTWEGIDLNKDFKQGSPLLDSLKLETNWPQEEWFNMWRSTFKNTLNGNIDTWDYQWLYSCLKNQLLCVRPNVNLVNNIGFNEDATHTQQMDDLDEFSLATSPIKMEGHAEFTPKLDPNFERDYVAKKWQHFKLDHRLVWRKIFKKLSRMFSS